MARFLYRQKSRFTVVSVEPYPSVWRVTHASLFCVSVIIVLVFALPGSPPSASARSQQHQASTSPVLVLELRKPIEQELSAGQPQHYAVSLAARQYLRLAIECWGINVRVALSEPSGRLHTESICYRGGRVTVSLTADASGSYRLTLEASEAGSIVGHYKILLEEIRKTVPHDQSRILAEQAFKAAERLRAGQTPGDGLRA